MKTRDVTKYKQIPLIVDYASESVGRRCLYMHVRLCVCKGVGVYEDV